MNLGGFELAFVICNFIVMYFIFEEKVKKNDHFKIPG
jgi:hypothetical protein